MQRTTNYGLNKPELSGFYNVEHFNENMDKIDSEMNKFVTGETAVNKATNDASGNNIASTYVKNSAASSRYVGNPTMNSIGWWRIAKYASSNANNSKGGCANSCNIILKRAFSNANNEYHNVTLLSTFNSSKFKDNENKSNTQIITKIRHVVDTSTNTAYIEVYYNASTNNALSVTINNTADVGTLWTPMVATKTSETVDNVTVMSSMNLVANSNGEASKLSTARKIGNASFDGSADIALKDVLFSGYASSGTLKYSADNYDYLIIDATFTDTNNNSYDTCFMIVNSVSSWYDGCNWSYVDDNGTIWNSNFSFNVNGTSFSITANTESYDMNTEKHVYTDCSVKISAIHGFKF